MGRWTQYDEDDYRLPEGMKRIGYDADSGRYYFEGGDRSIWRGAEGSEFGEMTKVSGLPPSLGSQSNNRRSEDLEAAPPTRSDGYQLLDPSRTMAARKDVNTSAYRSLFPFFLMIAVVLLLVWRLILSPGLAPAAKRCPENTTLYVVQPGDNCWEIAKTHGCALDEFKELNPKVKCEPLMPGTSVCLPEAKNGVKLN